MIKLDSNTCAEEISVCFAAIPSEFIRLEMALIAKKEVHFIQESINLFFKPNTKLRRHKYLLHSRLMKRMMIREIDRNILADNHGYFIFLQNCFERYFNFLSTFSDALNLYQYNRQLAGRILKLLSDTLNGKYMDDEEMEEVSIEVAEKPTGYFSDDCDTYKVDKTDFLLAVQLFLIDTYWQFEQLVKILYPSFITLLNVPSNTLEPQEYLRIKFKDLGVVSTLIYNDLFDAGFIKCSQTEFTDHFGLGKYSKKIDWYATESILTYLFFGHDFLAGLFKSEATIDLCRSLALHFFNKRKGQVYRAEQLHTAYLKPPITPRASTPITKLLEKLRNH